MPCVASGASPLVRSRHTAQPRSVSTAPKGARDRWGRHSPCLPPSAPGEPLIRSLSLSVCSLQTFRVKEITQYLVFCVLTPSLAVFLRFTRVVAHGVTPFLPAPNNTHCIDTTSCLPPLDSGWAGAVATVWPPRKVPL